MWSPKAKNHVPNRKIRTQEKSFDSCLFIYRLHRCQLKGLTFKIAQTRVELSAFYRAIRTRTLPNSEPEPGSVGILTASIFAWVHSSYQAVPDAFFGRRIKSRTRLVFVERFCYLASRVCHDLCIEVNYRQTNSPISPPEEETVPRNFYIKASRPSPSGGAPPSANFTTKMRDLISRECCLVIFIDESA